MISYLILLTVKRFVNHENYHVTGIAIIALLSVFTSLSWVNGQLLPDIFAPLGILSLFHLLFKKGLNRTNLALLVFIYILSSAVHISHIMIHIILLIFVLITYLIYKQTKFFKTVSAKWLGGLLIITMIGYVAMSSAVSKSTHVFLMSRLVENGIAYSYLHEYCGEKDYRLCAYKDSLPDNAINFIWTPQSPLSKIGWKESKEEFREIIFQTLIKPKYLIRHILESIKVTFMQLARFEIGDGNGVFSRGTHVHAAVFKYFPQEIQQYNNSKQIRNNLIPIELPNTINYFITGASFVLLIIMIGFQKLRILLPFQTRYLVYFIITSIIINAWVSGTFANAVDRLGSRMVWLLPFVVIISGIVSLEHTGISFIPSAKKSTCSNE